MNAARSAVSIIAMSCEPFRRDHRCPARRGTAQRLPHDGVQLAVLGLRRSLAFGAGDKHNAIAIVIGKGEVASRKVGAARALGLKGDLGRERLLDAGAMKLFPMWTLTGAVRPMTVQKR